MRAKGTIVRIVPKSGNVESLFTVVDVVRTGAVEIVANVFIKSIVVIAALFMLVDALIRVVAVVFPVIVVAGDELALVPKVDVVLAVEVVTASVFIFTVALFALRKLGTALAGAEMIVVAAL